MAKNEGINGSVSQAQDQVTTEAALAKALEEVREKDAEMRKMLSIYSNALETQQYLLREVKAYQQKALMMRDTQTVDISNFQKWLNALESML